MKLKERDGAWYVNRGELWWVDKIREMARSKCLRSHPHLRCEASMVGFNPSVCRTLEEAKVLIEELEEQRNLFSATDFRIVVHLLTESGEVSLIRHADVTGGKMTDLFWSPHKDWSQTPCIDIRGPAEPGNEVPIRFP